MSETSSRRGGWTADEITELLRRADLATEGVLTMSAVSEWARAEGVRAPSQRTYTVHFGGWLAACETSQVEARVMKRRPGPSPIEARTCWAAVRAFLSEADRRGVRPTVELYELLSREHAWPARNTLVLRTGRRWPELLAEAPRHRVTAAPESGTGHPRRAAPPATTKEMIAALVAAAASRPDDPVLSIAKYELWAGTQVGMPTFATIRAQFGTWAKACVAAGVVASRSAWSKETAEPVLRRAVEAVGPPFTVWGYTSFVDTQPERHRWPAPSVIVRLYGSWSDMCSEFGTTPSRRVFADDEIDEALAAANQAVGPEMGPTAYGRWVQSEAAAGRVRPTPRTIRSRRRSFTPGDAPTGAPFPHRA